MTSQATHKHLFYLEMAKLLEAGFGIREAAAVLLDTRLPPVQAKLLEDLNRGLSSGNSITEAFSTDRKVVSELERTMISAGERGGSLAPAFQHLADYFGMISAAHSQAIKSMIYPAIVLHMGIFIGIVPTAMMHGESLSTMIITFTTALVLVYLCAFVILVIVRAFLAAAVNHPGIDRVFRCIPVIGKARLNMAMARFCKVYHACLLSGISMIETVQVASSASQSGMLREAGKGLLETAKAGTSLGPRFTAANAFPKPFARSYTTGEEAGTLDTDLARWSKHFQNEAEAGAKAVSIVIPKVLYLLIMLFVAWKIISFFNGYYGGMLEELES
jgi:type IV pilus assembly protein PilC